MKRSYVLAGAALIVLVMFVLLVSAPVSVDAAPKDQEAGTHQFTPRPPAGDFEAFLAEPNCTWECSDGRKGSAEVVTVDQCEAACEGACGENCEPAAN